MTWISYSSSLYLLSVLGLLGMHHHAQPLSPTYLPTLLWPFTCWASAPPLTYVTSNNHNRN